jgi:hypothetical protein
MLKKQLCESTENLVELVDANMLKNQCESTEILVGLVRAKYENSTDHFKDSCDYLQNYWYEQQWNKNQELLAPMNTKSRRAQVSEIQEVISEDSLMDSRVVAYRHAKMKDMFGGLARTRNFGVVRCHLQYCDKLAYLTRSHQVAYATADSGADRNVLGKEWLIVSRDHSPQVRRRYDTSQVHFVKQYDVGQLLGTLSYHELFGFLPEDPPSDSYVCAKQTHFGRCAKTQQFFSRMTNNGVNPNPIR